MKLYTLFFQLSCSSTAIIYRGWEGAYNQITHIQNVIKRFLCMQFSSVYIFLSPGPPPLAAMPLKKIYFVKWSLYKISKIVRFRIDLRVLFVNNCSLKYRLRIFTYLLYYITNLFQYYRMVELVDVYYSTWT